MGKRAAHEPGAGLGALIGQLLDVGVAAVVIDGDVDEDPASAAVALGLAAAGMYAVMTVAVAARRREFGVRMALGAPPRGMVRLVLRGAIAQIAIGMLLGVGLTLALSRVLGAVLQEIGRSVFDPFALAGVCAVLALAGLLACLVPALRAARVPPMHALRGE